ncbi:hypothetical protein [Dactylosporangium sp. NPDC048998]|uniref:hypothetical protein n=1 Tax=Dactylosporangium sp. NPDC048998 TaxID=3363976 RepID=UPI003712B3EB
MLHYTRGGSLYALWWLIDLRGARRGEACGLRWSEVDLDRGVLFVVCNRTTAGYRIRRSIRLSASGGRRGSSR